MLTWTGNQTNFRIRTISAGTAAANAAFNASDPALNTNASVDVDTPFRLRVEIDETAGSGASANKTFKLRYALNGSGTYIDVPTSGGPVNVVGNSTYADDTATTNLLTGSARPFLAGYADDTDNLAPTAGQQAWTGGEHTELDFCLQVDSAQVANGDTLDFRVYESSGTQLTAYTRTPRVTVVESTPSAVPPPILVMAPRGSA